MCGCLLHAPGNTQGNLACNLGIGSDWESNQPPFGSQAGAQSTEPHQPRQNIPFFITNFSSFRMISNRDNLGLYFEIIIASISCFLNFSLH